MPILPREQDEPQFTYFIREYLLPGIVFFFMARWLFRNVVSPMLHDKILPARVKRNSKDDNDFLDAPSHAKME